MTGGCVGRRRLTRPGSFPSTARPTSRCRALKPVGNPLAAGLPGTPSRAPREVTVRLRETDGQAAMARLRLAAGIEAAWRSDLLEERYGAERRRRRDRAARR